MLKLICPDCKHELTTEENQISCNSCKRNFKTIKGVPILLPKRVSNFKKTEIEFYRREFKKKKDMFSFVESDWDKNTFGLLDFVDAIEKYPKDSKILELGAGNGQYSLILKKRGFNNTITSDISPNGLIAAREYSKSNDSFFVFDAENIPFDSGTFDIVFLTASLHHLQNPEKGITEMKRCAKKKGLIIVALEPNSWYYYVVRPIAKLLKIRLADKSKGPVSIGDEITHGFSLGKLKNYFKMQNIKVVETQRVWYLTGLVYYLPEFIKRMFGKRVSISSDIRGTTLKIDKILSRIPLISYFSFHNTVIGVKR